VQEVPTEHGSPYALRVTARCLTEDLGFATDDLARPIEQLAETNAVVSAFLERRAQLPIDQDRIRGLKASIVAYSLHAGAFRGLTWHDERNGVVWLLAARFHRSGRRDDSYPYFRALHREDLLPSREDYRRHFDAQARTFAKALLQEPAELLRQARARPGGICTGRVADRIDVRVVVMEDDHPPPLVTVAFGLRLHPGTTDVPGDWLVQLAAAFLPDTPFDQLMLADELAGGPVRADEVAFCGLDESADTDY